MAADWNLWWMWRDAAGWMVKMEAAGSVIVGVAEGDLGLDGGRRMLDRAGGRWPGVTGLDGGVGSLLERGGRLLDVEEDGADGGRRRWKIEGSESSRRGRHFGWLGSAFRITAGKLAAGSHGCRPWR
ncbi:hypothetical protein ACLOJK_018690 [Asimina triloba]